MTSIMQSNPHIHSVNKPTSPPHPLDTQSALESESLKLLYITDFIKDEGTIFRRPLPPLQPTASSPKVGSGRWDGFGPSQGGHEVAQAGGGGRYDLNHNSRVRAGGGKRDKERLGIKGEKGVDVIAVVVRILNNLYPTKGSGKDAKEKVVSLKVSKEI
jgi:hypothetical protein